jgi:hypothetical protein
MVLYTERSGTAGKLHRWKVYGLESDGTRNPLNDEGCFCTIMSSIQVHITAGFGKKSMSGRMRRHRRMASAASSGHVRDGQSS